MELHITAVNNRSKRQSCYPKKWWQENGYRTFSFDFMFDGLKLSWFDVRFHDYKLFKGVGPLLPNAPNQPCVHPKTTKFGTLRISSNYGCSKNVSCLPPTQTFKVFALKFSPKEVHVSFHCTIILPSSSHQSLTWALFSCMQTYFVY